MNFNAGILGMQALYLFVAFVLSLAIGIERQARHKDAGMRTHTLVGVGSALFVIIGKYGFLDVLSANVKVDPSRVAAQIVSGIGFIGAGVVFTQRSHVRGLTTAASIWLTAAIGTACGAGLVIPAAVCTLLYFITVLLIPFFTKKFVPGFGLDDTLRLRYKDGHGTLRSILSVCAAHGVSVEGFSTHRRGDDAQRTPTRSKAAASKAETSERIVTANLAIRGRDSAELISDLSDLEGVISATRISSTE